jgi:hypothetical protein
MNIRRFQEIRGRYITGELPGLLKGFGIRS